MEKFKLTLKKLKAWYFTKILRKTYYRVGSCNMCGRCCEKIYVKHGKRVIDDEDFFNKLKTMHNFYDGLTCIGKDETGLIFRCNHLDQETRKCKIHKKREKICRDYPQEELFSFGGTMGEDCGYKFVPIISFDEVMAKVSKSEPKTFELMEE